ncbi:MAG: 50S ribosome-binding GTPase [Bacteroidetes bacterium]|nr:50S ribosome-binding GTPase [Bacteroidota bacterium]
MELLRFTTAGSVDDGKSTLIGRLLYDTKQLFDDTIETVERISKQKGLSHLDLALITDGLKAEREQGITIDVAYRYFNTPKRKFIIADTPGHVQYTRNMVTGASTANLALVLIDARNGVVEQTKRHSFIASLLHIPHLVLCINKMDLVNYSEDIFNRIVEEYETFAAKFEIVDIHFIPISARNGDNIVDRSANMPWYKGPTLMYLLENIHIGSDQNLTDCRFPVQYIVRPHSEKEHDFRGYAGRIRGGVFRTGDRVIILPTEFFTTIKEINWSGTTVKEAFPPMSVTMQLGDDIDISRGDMIVRENNVPKISQEIDAMICWLNPKKLLVNGRYIIRHTTREAKCFLKEIVYKIDINTLHRNTDDKEIAMNDIARIRLKSAIPLFYDPYRRNRITGSFILVDEFTNETVGAGMINQ